MIPPNTIETHQLYSFNILLEYSCFRASGNSDGKESACNVGGPGSILGPEDALEKRDGYPLQGLTLC